MGVNGGVRQYSVSIALSSADMRLCHMTLTGSPDSEQENMCVVLCVVHYSLCKRRRRAGGIHSERQMDANKLQRVAVVPRRGARLRAFRYGRC